MCLYLTKYANGGHHTEVYGCVRTVTSLFNGSVLLVRWRPVCEGETKLVVPVYQQYVVFKSGVIHSL